MTTYPTTRAVARDAGVDRVLVNGVDITWFRASDPGDKPTKVPGYTLTEPFAYGSSKPLTIPRTNCNFEAPGTGALAWLHKDARVQYQRVYNAGTEDEEVVTDYRGFISAIHATGREFTCDVDGEISGRANLIDKTPVLIRKVYDLGSLMGFATDTLGMHFTTPDTGLMYPNEGGMTLLAWMSKLGVLSQTANVPQRALMPTVWGGTDWVFNAKDTTTVDCTVFSDGSRIVLDLVDDRAEQPNTVYGNGVSPDGERWRGARYPGFFQGTPAPYPFIDDRDFGTGTTDGDTDTGDGITALVKKLAWMGYLNDAHSDVTTYTIYVARAVLHLQEDAGLTADGEMTPATWLALWDVDVVGHSLEGARIFPLAQEARIRNYNYSSTGAIMGRNPLHQAGSIRVDRTIDFGVCDKETAINYARSLIHNTDGHQWAGTITLNLWSVISGERDAAYALAFQADPEAFADDVMPQRDIRPGMNAWLPYFDGGTLVHISGVDVTPVEGGYTVVLTVDTGASDIFDITQAMQRNRDSRRNLWREWSEVNRGVRPTGNFISRDEFFGKLYQGVELAGEAWTEVELIMSQSGTVNASDIKLDTETEFAYFVTRKKIGQEYLDGFLGDPMSVDEDGRTVWEHDEMQSWFEDKIILFLKGQGLQPCGYGWRKGYTISAETGEPTRTANPLTGTDLDHSSWAYHADRENAALVYLYIWPLEDCKLKRGHLFAALEDDVT